MMSDSTQNIHCDSNYVEIASLVQSGLAEVEAVPLPEKTRTYCPVPNKKLIDFVRDKACRKFGMTLERETYELSRKNQQMFGVMTFRTEDNEHSLSIGFRNSYDKSLPVGFIVGAYIIATDSYAFSSSSKIILRKHTINVWQEIAEKVSETLKQAGFHYGAINDQLKEMKTIPLSLSTGYDLVGRAVGFDFIKVQQASVIFREWEKPSGQESPKEWDLYRLYTSFMKGMKRGTAGEALERYTKAHDFFEPLLPAADHS